ncbi:MDR family MFS transporter [Actinomycetospora sp. CA-053990]|uniref:MDR family MFS transporter n=1 Tax=Actinomycetospora sp. CA-053990 TaxID=3239891 RepID=UPI003D89D315
MVSTETSTERDVDVAPTASGPAAPPSPAPDPPAPVAPTPTTSGPWAVSLIVLVTGMFMSVLDVSIVNVAIPAMQKDFGATTEDIQWVATSYSLALGVIVPASAWLGERIGLKRAYIFSLIGFAAGSALCGLAWDLNSMIAFRILQAIPGGVIPVVALSMLYRIVPREKIGAAMGMYGLGIIVAPAVGPTLGGYLVEYVDWRLIFFINVPIGVLGAIAAVVLLPAFRGGTSHRFDLPGFLAIAAGLFSLLLALSEGESWGWTSYPVLILLVFGTLCLALFVVIELEVDHPLLDVRVFRFWPFTNSLILIAVISIGLFGVLFYIPLYLQQYQGMGAFDSGLLLLPQAAVMAVMMPLAGRIYDRFGARWPAVIGLSVMAIGTFMLRDITLETSHTELQWLLAFRAGGIGLAMMPIMTNGLSAVPPENTSGASAFNNLVQRTSSAMGLAAMTALMTAQQAQGMSDMGGLMGAQHVPTSGAGAAAGADAGTASILQNYSMDQAATGQVFTTAFDNLMLITAGLSAVGVCLALLLRNKASASGEKVVVEA